MADYTITLEFSVEADTHEDAAWTFQGWLDENLIYGPYIEVTDDHGDSKAFDLEKLIKQEN